MQCKDWKRRSIARRGLVLPAEPGKPVRVDYEYERNGTANIFMFTEPLGGRRHVSIRERKPAVDWAYETRSLWRFIILRLNISVWYVII